MESWRDRSVSILIMQRAKDDTHVYIQGGYDGVERKADFFACDSDLHMDECLVWSTPPSPRYFFVRLYGTKCISTVVFRAPSV
jgi:hypothetical protein